VYDVAVVGSGGFLGGATVTALSASGARVGRFTRDIPLVDGGKLTARADAVVWAVGAVTPHDTGLADEQLGALAAFLTAASSAAHVPHVVLLSSGGAVYGPPSTAPFAESEPARPANAYGELKLAEERSLAASGLPHTVLRIANPYGPGQGFRRGQGVVAAWLAAARSQTPITLYGDGSTVRDYVFEADCASAILAAVERRPDGIVNVGSGVGVTLAELLERVIDTVAPVRVDVERLPARGEDPAGAWLDVRRAGELLNWRPSTSLADGLARTWAAVSA
jgi:UDP-glucose 4-epimerase